jgi:hypothetical protein
VPLFSQCDSILLEKIKSKEIQKILKTHKKIFAKDKWRPHFSFIMADDFSLLYFFGNGNIYTIQPKTLQVIAKDTVPFSFIAGKDYPILMYSQGKLGLAIGDFRKIVPYKPADFDILLFDEKKKVIFHKRYKTENYLEELISFYTYSFIKGKLQLISMQEQVMYSEGNKLKFYRERNIAANNTTGQIYVLDDSKMDLKIDGKVFIRFPFNPISHPWILYHHNHLFIKRINSLNPMDKTETSYDFNLLTKELKPMTGKRCAGYIPFNKGFYHLEMEELKIRVSWLE